MICEHWVRASGTLRVTSHHCKSISEQTCAKIPKRSQILGSLSPRSETLMDLEPCTSFLLWDSGNPGPQNFDSRKALETQDLTFWICGKTLETQNPEPQNFDVSRLLKSLDPTPFNTEFHAEPGSSTGDELGRSDSKNLNCKKKIQLTGPTLSVIGCSW